NYTNSDGANPVAGLILAGNTLYGTAQSGGSSAYGTVFKVNTDGMAFTNLHSFTNGSDGADPYAGLILSGNTLYGTTPGDGLSGFGTVFALKTNGSGFANLDSFTYNDGSHPYGGLILSGNTLYGTTSDGGEAGWGTLVQITTN